MRNKALIILILVIILFLPLKKAQAQLSFDFISTVRSLFSDGGIGDINRSVGVYPFGGRISSTGSGCVIDYVVWAPCPFFSFLCPYPGIAIPIPSSTSFDVNDTLPTPGEVFTFPLISRVFPNYNEDEVGVWSLGLAWSPFKPVIDAINDVLDTITIPIGVGFINGFQLECSESDDHVVLMVGTGGTQ